LVHGANHQVFETTPLLISVQYHTIDTRGRPLSSFVQSGLLPSAEVPRCFEHSCGTPGRRSEDVRIIFH
jgi:hypothetical protein